MKSLPLLGFSAFSGTGKTTLLVQLLRMFKQNNIRVGVIKHSHHAFDVDQSGKDSYEIRKAGAAETLVASKVRWALMVESEPQQEANLSYLLTRLDLDHLDLVLVEGFRDEDFPKIELHRVALDKPYLHESDERIIAFAVDAVNDFKGLSIPVLNINDIDQIYRFIMDYCDQYNKGLS